MGSRRFQFTVDHMVGRREIELVVTYSMTPGRPEQGPTYACGGQPVEPPEVEIIAVKHDGKPFVHPGRHAAAGEVRDNRVNVLVGQHTFEVADLLAYLRSPKQVALPDEKR